MAGNAIVNGVRSSLADKPLPPVKALVCGQDEKCQKLFDKLKDNGAKMWQKISLSTAIRQKAKYKEGQGNG